MIRSARCTRDECECCLCCTCSSLIFFVVLCLIPILKSPVVDGSFIPLHYGNTNIRIPEDRCYDIRFILEWTNETVQVDVEDMSVHRALHGHSGHSSSHTSGHSSGEDHFNEIHTKKEDLLIEKELNIISTRNIRKHILSTFYIITIEGMKYDLDGNYILIDMLDVCLKTGTASLVIQSQHEDTLPVYVAFM